MCVYTIVDNDDILKKSLKKLIDEKNIMLDCEGLDLSKKGKLCLLQIGTTKNIYIFDVSILGIKIFQEEDNLLKNILESNDYLKIVFDGRNDRDALMYQYNVKINNIFDVQILDYVSSYKKLNSNPIEEHIKRMITCLCAGGYWKNLMFPFCINGLKNVVERELPDSSIKNKFLAGKQEMRILFDKDITNFWDIRPFEKKVLDYAANDVLVLVELYNKMKRTCSQKDYDRTKIASEKYINPKIDNEYTSNAIIPLQIFCEQSYGNTVCSGCKESLPDNMFYKSNKISFNRCLRCALFDKQKTLR